MFEKNKKSFESLPIYEQIYQELVRRISSGEFSEGDRLPTEGDLMREFHASRQPVRYALDALEASGLIYRAQGRGSFVRKRMIGFSELLRNQGHEVGTRTLEVSLIVPTLEIASRLELINPEERVVHIRRIYDMDGDVLALFDIYLRSLVPLDFFIKSGNFLSLYKILRDAGYRLWDAIETIGAQSLSPEIARLLNQEPGAAALLIKRVSRSPEGEPLEYAVYHIRADRYEYQVYIGE